MQWMALSLIEKAAKRACSPRKILSGLALGAYTNIIGILLVDGCVLVLSQSQRKGWMRQCLTLHRQLSQ